MAGCATTLLAEPQAPPPAISISAPARATSAPAPVRAAAGTAAYSIGDPTDEEQLYLELVNRARANAAAEARRLANLTDPDVQGAYSFFKVDLQKFVADTSGYPVAQPLAFEPRMIDAARGHSTWMLTHGIQAHDQTDPPGSTNITANLGQRLTASGYPYFTAGESIYAFAQSPEHGHAGFEVDWGNGPGGMQNPPGHRNSNHNTAFREVGIGVLNGSGPNGTGPQVVTIDFGNRNDAGPLVTGVAYYDLNGNGFYDLGEGLGAIRVEVSGAGHHADTVASGGYAVPAANGERTVTFSGPGLIATAQTVTVADNLNVKADLPLIYATPVLTGPASPSVGRANFYVLPAVRGATGYRWSASPTAPWVGTEGGETGGTNLLFAVSEGHEPLTTSFKRSGNFAFQLTHRTATDQFMTFRSRFWIRPGAQLEFWKRLGFATSNETAVLQVSADEGSTWTTLWSQAGNGATTSTGIEQTFSRVNADLDPYAGRMVRIRYGYLYSSGSLFIDSNPTNRRFMWLFLDDLTFAGAELVGEGSGGEVSEPQFTFTPPSAASYLLSVRPLNLERLLPPSEVLPVTADSRPANSPPTLLPVDEQIARAGSRFSLQLEALDPDVPPQSLTFGLISGPPGLTVTAQGLVEWTPGLDQVNSMHAVAVSASDGELSASGHFNLQVITSTGGPAVLTPSQLSLATDGTLSLSFSLQSGSADQFALERSPALAPLNWSPAAEAVLTTNSPGSFTFRIPASAEAAFFRVVTP